ncbi:MAG: class I SAM-dependent methyltransferase [Parachlamydiales bacterium]|nr:class I SAM-dependent methyltransferase [Parachlamydiales bacterium]
MKYYSHLDLAKALWVHHLQEKDYVIDATCGNGHDALFLAKRIPKGKLFLFDIQQQALEATRTLLEGEFPSGAPHIDFFHASHEDLSIAAKDQPPSLIVYNLGYLPGSDKKITTTASSTIKSLESALSILAPEGAISIMCYPGHPEGKRESEAIFEFLPRLDPGLFAIYQCQNYCKNNAPFLIWIKKTTL